MRQINPVFLIGTLGMLFTSMLHIIMAAVTSEETASTTFWGFYPVFAGFLLAGTIIMMRRKQSIKR